MSTPAIQIILNSDGTTSFSPSPQTALFSGLVFWNNQTKEHHWPWPTDSNYNPQATGWFPAVPPGELQATMQRPQQFLRPRPTTSNDLLLLQAPPSQNQRKRDDQRGYQLAVTANHESPRISQWLRVTQTLKTTFL